LTLADTLVSDSNVVQLSQGCAQSGLAAVSSVVHSVSVKPCAQELGESVSESDAQVVATVLNHARSTAQQIGLKLAAGLVHGESGKTMVTNTSVHHLWHHSLNAFTQDVIELDLSPLFPAQLSDPDAISTIRLPPSLPGQLGVSGLAPSTLHIWAQAATIGGVESLSPMVSISLSEPGVDGSAALAGLRVTIPVAPTCLEGDTAKSCMGWDGLEFSADLCVTLNVTRASATCVCDTQGPIIVARAAASPADPTTLPDTLLQPPILIVTGSLSGGSYYNLVSVSMVPSVDASISYVAGASEAAVISCSDLGPGIVTAVFKQSATVTAVSCSASGMSRASTVAFEVTAGSVVTISFALSVSEVDEATLDALQTAFAVLFVVDEYQVELAAAPSGTERRLASTDVTVLVLANSEAQASMVVATAGSIGASDIAELVRSTPGLESASVSSVFIAVVADARDSGDEGRVPTTESDRKSGALIPMWTIALLAGIIMLFGLICVGSIVGFVRKRRKLLRQIAPMPGQVAVMPSPPVDMTADEDMPYGQPLSRMGA